WIGREPAVSELGRRLAAGEGGVLAGARWTSGSAARLEGRADLVTAGYLLGELADRQRDDLVDRLWAATDAVLVLVEPGSKAGFERIRAARARLIEAGGHAVAPCPNDQPCPLI